MTSKDSVTFHLCTYNRSSGGSQKMTTASFTTEHICTLLYFYFNTTYFKCRKVFYRQKYKCIMGYPMWPIIPDLYMEELESRALGSFKEIAPSHLVVQICGLLQDQNQNPVSRSLHWSYELSGSKHKVHQGGYQGLQVTTVDCAALTENNVSFLVAHTQTSTYSMTPTTLSNTNLDPPTPDRKHSL